LLIQNKNIKLILNYFCGPLVFCILLFSINNQLHQQSDWQHSLERLHSALNSEALAKILLVLFLMVLNWGIEAAKWKEAMKVLSPVTLPRGLKAIFSGNALAFFTPNRTGEYFGRMIYVKKGERVSSIPLTILCSIAQLMATLFAGCAGLVYIKDRIIARFGGDVTTWLNIGMYAVLAAAIVLTIFYFRIRFLVKWIAGRRWARSWSRHLMVLEDVNATILTSILSLSIARYIVFIIQYYLLFSVFGIDVNWWQAFWAVSVVFLVIAVVPSLGFLSELGVRWQAGIQVVQVFSSNITGIFATSLSIWIINLVIPALIGGFMLLALKLFRK
jgi:uncharacterized membrane protein YbhN (UPF0104 family)